MKLSEMRVLITGGTGGIGSAIGAELLACGAAVLLVARDEAALSRAAASHAVNGTRIGTVSADLTVPADRQRVCKAASTWCGGIKGRSSRRPSAGSAAGRGRRRRCRKPSFARIAGWRRMTRDSAFGRGSGRSC